MEFPFTANSQEEFDKAISERLAREAKKYEGFETYRDKAAKYDELVKRDLDGQLKAAQDELKKAQSELSEAQTKAKADLDAEKAISSDLTAQLETAKLSNLRVEAALNAGLSYTLADRLQGTTAEELKADAEKLAPFFTKTVPTQPIGGNEPAKHDGDSNNAMLMSGMKPELYGGLAQLAASL